MHNAILRLSSLTREVKYPIELEGGSKGWNNKNGEERRVQYIQAGLSEVA